MESEYDEVSEFDEEDKEISYIFENTGLETNIP